MRQDGKSTLITDAACGTINTDRSRPPDWIKTAKQLSADSGGDWRAYLPSAADEHAPIKRFGAVEELADFVFLCSDRASSAVDATCFDDGGMLRTI
jgi:NAD(P)-dependent dehydrogenase (short-subunit alcohol dehydrogenase family)